MCVGWFPCFYFFFSFVCWYSVGGKFNCVTSSSAIAGIPGKNKRTRTLFSLLCIVYIFFLLSRLGHFEMWVCSKGTDTHRHTRTRGERRPAGYLHPPPFHLARRLLAADDGALSRCVFKRGTCERPVTGKATSLVDNSFRSLMVFPPFSLIRLF